MRSKDVIEQLTDAHRLIRDAALGLEASGREVLGKDLKSKAKGLAKIINAIHESVTLDEQLDLTFAIPPAQEKKTKKE